MGVGVLIGRARTRWPVPLFPSRSHKPARARRLALWITVSGPLCKDGRRFWREQRLPKYSDQKRSWTNCIGRLCVQFAVVVLKFIAVLANGQNGQMQDFLVMQPTRFSARVDVVAKMVDFLEGFYNSVSIWPSFHHTLILFLSYSVVQEWLIFA